MQPDLFYGETMYHSSYDHLSPILEHGPPDSRSPSMYPERERDDPPVLELRVPMCCEKCAQKVKEGLDELEGVCDVQCDLFHQRVTITGFVDANRALTVVKRVKKKSEYFQQGSYIERNSLDPHHASRINSMDPQHASRSPVHSCVDLYEPGASFHGVRGMPSSDRHGHHHVQYISLEDEYPLIYGDSNYRSSSCRFPTFRCWMCVRECPNVLEHYY